MTNPRNTTRSASLARPLRRTRGPENPTGNEDTHNQYNAETQVKRQAERGGSRNGKTANRLSECTLGSHCRRRRGESVPHITLLSWVVAERIASLSLARMGCGGAGDYRV